MANSAGAAWRHAQSIFQTLSLIFLIGLALAALAATVLAAAGVLPWLGLDLRFGANALSDAGPWVQVGLTVFLLGLCFFLPANARMMRLERSHRAFNVAMEDVTRAYVAAHQADRKDAFALSSEFDAMRERILHLREHPDLGQLEPELLELAAQMSFESRDLARIYSDEKVNRAKAFLKQRQEEAEAMKDRIRLARYTCDEMKRWLQDVETEERQAVAQMERLEKDLRDVLPLLGYDFEDVQPNVVPMSAKPQAKPQ